MSELVGQMVGAVKVVIDRSLCVAFAQFLDVSEVAFRLGDDDVVEFESPDEVSQEELLAACRACPVEALWVFDTGSDNLSRDGAFRHRLR